MNGRGIWGDTVTLIRRTVVGQDKYGDDVQGETREVLEGVSLHSVETSETQTQQRDQLLQYYRLYIPWLHDLSGLDAVEWESVGGTKQAEVAGPPQVFRSASGRLDHTAVSLRQIGG